jgi:MarR family transcriptional regulator, transcriptional regulator for hemolysin
MNEIDILEKQKYIFKKLFLLSNRLQTVGDKILTGEMTIMQWLLTVAVLQYKDSSPTLSEVAQLMGSSRQNVKQIAVKLQKENFLTIDKDGQDTRITRLKLTEKSCFFWQKRNEEIRNFLVEIFNELNKDDIELLYDCLNKLYDSIMKMENVLINYEGC